MGGGRGARRDLEALAGRSRITEAAALTDPAGLGAHTVLRPHQAALTIVVARGDGRPDGDG